MHRPLVAAAPGVFLCALLAVAPARGQTSDEPTIVLTIFGGAVTGHPLWSIRGQPLVVEGTETTSTPQYDTLALRRTVGAGLTLGARGAYFPGRRFGLELDVSFIDLPYDGGCSGWFYPNADDRNEQVCEYIDRANAGGSLIAGYAGVTVRPWGGGGGGVRPFVRAGVGVANITRSTVDVSGIYVRSDGAVRNRAVVVDDSPRRVSPSFVLGAGLTSALGAGYRLRLDVRDMIVGFDELQGPADNLGRAPVRTRYRHRLALSLGLDIILEKRRGRRY